MTEHVKDDINLCWTYKTANVGAGEVTTCTVERNSSNVGNWVV